jgi:hypothetical protein
MLRTAALLALLPWAGVPCHGQAISLRFDPEILTRVVTVSRSDIVIVVEDTSATAGRADTVFVRLLEGVTRFVDAVDRGIYSIFLQYDSVRARQRTEDLLWRSVGGGARERASVRALLDNRMRVTSAEFVDLPHLAASRSEMLRGLAGGLHLALPDTAVRVGSAWMGELRMSLAAHGRAAGSLGMPAGGEIVSRISVKLDSARVRGIDTLAYLTLRGRFAPQSIGVAAQDEGRVAVAQGSVSATMAWSTSWDAYVTGAVRSDIQVDLRQAGDLRMSPRVRIYVTTQFQVRV